MDRSSRHFGRVQGGRADQEVNDLVSSPAWLRINGLKASKLTLPQILTQVGFQHRKDYVSSLRRPVSSQYAAGLFPRVLKSGAVYNLTTSRQHLEALCQRLEQKAKLYRQRLAWLTTGSRQLFGVIQERGAALVMNFGSARGADFTLGQNSVCMVVREQVSQIAWFNLIRSGPQAEPWQERAECTSPSNISAAVQWVQGLRPMPSCPTHTSDALLEAMRDPKVEAVYLFVVGDLEVDVMDLLKEDGVRNAQPIHTVSFNTKREATIEGLKEISRLTAGRFHAFAEMHLFEDVSHDGVDGDYGNESLLRVSCQPIGGMPPGAGVREDVFLVWREMQEALDTRTQVHNLMLELPSSSPYGDCEDPAMSGSEDCLSSRAWLSHRGLKAQKLWLYDVLADCAFRHSDGILVVNPSAETEQKNKLVNARYCSQFAHMKWKDSSVVHVYVSLEKSRWYQDRMDEALGTLQRRLEWLQQGSRELFGVVLELQVYILIDTSESMKDLLPLLKDKLQQLIQEQLRHRSKVNFVAFGTQLASWKAKLMDVTEKNLEGARHWVRGLQAGGSRNILGALQVALADIGTNAIYMLANGQPEQLPSVILAEAQLDPLVPVHTISFSCSDPETNRFLLQLSQETGGRYHCYGNCKDPEVPSPYMSEDIHLLEEEMEEGRRSLETVLKLRAECVMLDWHHNRGSDTTHRTQVRPHSAPQLQGGTRQAHKPRSALGQGQLPEGCERRPPRQASHRSARCKQSNSSSSAATLLEFLGRGVGLDQGASLQEWMLPETKSLFQMNVEKQKQVLSSLELSTVDNSMKKKCRTRCSLSLDVPTARWLRKNGLVARRLTITDALAPAAVSQKAKYVPILDKNIYSKVFDEMLQLAHVSSDSRRLTLVNPLAVDLDDYKTRLQEALATYERRLDLIVWRALTEEARERFGNDKPVAFKEHREALLQALEDLGWPLPREDVDLLEDQVRLGRAFLQQASDLQQAIKQKIPQQEPDAGNRANTMQRKADKRKPRRSVDSVRGQRAIARSERDGFYYAGTVRRRVRGLQALVDFSSGGSEIVPLRFLITLGGSSPCPPLAVGDFVFVGSGDEGAGNCFVPGVVIATPCRLESRDKLYTIFKYDDRKVHATRKKMIKISHTRYKLTCRYITEQMEKESGRLPEVSQEPVVLSQRGRMTSLPLKEPKILAAYREEEMITCQNVRRQHLPRSCLHQISDEDAVLERQEAVSHSCRRAGEQDRSLEAWPRPDSSHSSRSSSEPATSPTPPSSHHAPCLLGGQEKLEVMALGLLEALRQQRGRQEEIQKRVRVLSEIQQALQKPQTGDHKEEELKELTNQQLSVLAELKDLVLPSTMGTNHNTDGVTVPEYMNAARLHLPKVAPGQNVLARTSHDGWYHRSSIIHACGDQSFFLQSGTGMLERVWPEDIITEGDDSGCEIKVEDPVIGAHPLYDNRYCPGAVVKITEDLKMKVRCYDGTESLVSREKAYLIPAEKFERDVAYILECEERWVGELVVARHDLTGSFHLAEVQRRLGNGRQYLIQWADGTSSVQDREWIFGKWSPSRTLEVGDHVLALAHKDSHTFLPGVIFGFSGAAMLIQFINGERCVCTLTAASSPKHCAASACQRSSSSKRCNCTLQRSSTGWSPRWTRNLGRQITPRACLDPDLTILTPLACHSSI